MNYLFMKKMCSKLIDIKILNNDILYDQQDILYENNFILDYENYNQKYINDKYEEIANFNLNEPDAID